MSASYFYCFFFFFQAEDGIRDYKVTGVQTCALPFMERERSTMGAARAEGSRRLRGLLLLLVDDRDLQIVEERLEQFRFLSRQVAARLDLQRLEKIDDLPGAVEVHLDLSGERVR